MKERLLSGETLSFAVEGKSTNLVVWVSAKRVLFRLDKFQQYSAPLSLKSVEYFDQPRTDIEKLANKFGFDRATTDDLDEIVAILEPLKERELKDW